MFFQFREHGGLLTHKMSDVWPFCAREGEGVGEVVVGKDGIRRWVRNGKIAVLHSKIHNAYWASSCCAKENPALLFHPGVAMHVLGVRAMTTDEFKELPSMMCWSVYAVGLQVKWVKQGARVWVVGAREEEHVVSSDDDGFIETM